MNTAPSEVVEIREPIKNTMKHIALSLLAAAGLAVTSARADHVAVGGSITFGSPGYVAPAPGYYGPGYYGPGYYAPANGYWRDVAVNVWVPGHWESGRDYMGNYVNRWDPGHYVVRSQRVWVNAYDDREQREHEWREHEHWEHERREHGDWDHDDRRR